MFTHVIYNYNKHIGNKQHKIRHTTKNKKNKKKARGNS